MLKSGDLTPAYKQPSISTFYVGTTTKYQRAFLCGRWLGPEVENKPRWHVQACSAMGRTLHGQAGYTAYFLQTYQTPGISTNLGVSTLSCCKKDMYCSCTLIYFNKAILLSPNTLMTFFELYCYFYYWSQSSHGSPENTLSLASTIACAVSATHALGGRQVLSRSPTSPLCTQAQCLTFRPRLI